MSALLGLAILALLGLAVGAVLKRLPETRDPSKGEPVGVALIWLMAIGSFALLVVGLLSLLAHL